MLLLGMIVSLNASVSLNAGVAYHGNTNSKNFIVQAVATMTVRTAEQCSTVGRMRSGLGMSRARFVGRNNNHLNLLLMIDFNVLVINRIIIHTINQKQAGQDCATAHFSEEISIVDENALSIIRSRLIDAAGRDSKAFEMEIERTEEDSVFGICRDINGLSDPDFVRDSSDIALLLARAQTKQSIPGGYLIVMDCSDATRDYFACIVIKAEPHEALQLARIDGRNQLAVLDKVFLSPSQKFFKIGIIYQRSDEEKC